MVQGFRISPQQKRIWQWQQAQAGFPTRAAIAFQVAGPVDRNRLRAALERVVTQTAMLKTRLETPAGMNLPLQVTGAASVHWRELPPGERDDSLAAMADRLLRTMTEPRQPADGDEALVEIWLRELDPRNALVLLAAPPYQVDRTSLVNLVAAWAEALGDAEPCDEPVPYLEVSEWLHELLASEDARPGREFWQDAAIDPGLLARPETLEGGMAPAPWAFDRVAVPPLPATDAANLRGLADRLACPLAHVCLALWAALQYRLHGCESLLIAVAAEGRPEPELQRVIGPLARFLPIRLDVTPRSRIGDLVARLRSQWDDAETWQECFAWEDLNPTSSEPPYCALAFETLPALAAFTAGDGRFQVLASHHPGDRFHLKLCCRPEPDGPMLTIEYDPARHPTAEAMRLADHYAQLLADLARQPGTAIAGACILTRGQRQALLRTLDGGLLPSSQQSSVVQVFLEMASRHPDLPALVTESEQLTYRQLANRARSIARQLAAHGCGVEDRVGLFCDNRPDMYAGLIAILLCGSVYLPLDPEYPRARLQFMIEDAAIDTLLTTRELAANLGYCQAKIIDLEAIEAEGPIATAAAPVRIHPEQGAYIIYTSGSTGTPKGSLVDHGALLRHCIGIRDRLAIARHDRVLQMTSLGFDPALEQIWTALISGAALVPARPKHWDLEQLAEKLIALEVTHANWSTSYWHHLVAQWSREPERVPSLPLKVALVGGEAMLAQPAAAWLTMQPHCRLLNVYGPTETIVSATICELDAGHLSSDEALPIGLPLAGRQAYILDGGGRLAPPGTPGELALGGPLLARGYHRRPASTATAFQPDPFSDAPGARLYRTGDQVVLSAANQLLFRGRQDHQVKVRGYRVELGEVERALGRLAVVAEVAVIAQKRIQGDFELAAFFTTSRGLAADIDALRAELARQLPAYMVPKWFRQLASLPLSPTGKMDRHALADLRPESRELPSLAPADSPFAAILRDIWCELLDVPFVADDDHFLEMGGHSLLAIQLVSRIRAALDIHYSLDDVFMNAHFCEMVAGLESAVRRAHGPDRPPLEPATRPAHIPLSAAQRRLWLTAALNRNNDAYHVPLALTIEGDLDLAVLERAISAILERHESLRTVFCMAGDEPYQKIMPLGDRALAVIDGSRLEPAARESLTRLIARRCARKPFDLERGPLYRFFLLKLAARHHLLFLTLHHITSDAWSLSVLSRELVELYRAFGRGQTSPLASLPVQYADYALWQNRWFQTGAAERDLAFWRQRLSHLPGPLNLPAKAAAGNAAGRIAVDFPAETTQQCKAFARKREVTLFMLLLGAFKGLLFHLTGRSDQVVGTDVANRNHRALEPLIGFFINQLVVRTDLTGDPSFVDLLARIRRNTLEAYRHQELPFDKLVEALNPERGPDISPFFQAKLVLVNTPQTRQQIAGLTFSPLPAAERDTKLDVQLNLWEEGDRLRGVLRYKRDKFDPAYMAACARQFQDWLTQALAQPHWQLSQFGAWLDEREEMRQQQIRLAAADKTRNKFLNLKPGKPVPTETRRSG